MHRLICLLLLPIILFSFTPNTWAALLVPGSKAELYQPCKLMQVAGKPCTKIAFKKMNCRNSCTFICNYLLPVDSNLSFDLFFPPYFNYPHVKVSVLCQHPECLYRPPCFNLRY